MVEVILMHPVSRLLYRCRVRANRDGLLLCRVSGHPEASDAHAPRVESEPIAIGWRTLRGFSADESYETPAGRRLQVLEVDTDDGVLTLLCAAADVSQLLAAVATWAGHWRRARSPLGLVFGGVRRRGVRQVA